MNKKRAPREGARADERWETEGGSLDASGNEADAADAQADADARVDAHADADADARVDADVEADAQVDSVADADAAAGRGAAQRREGRWRAAQGEHWHKADYTDETKRRDGN
ncbi:hypothetical protein PX701_05405 [Agromyces sp. H3Y2-19a]|uniref:hypothetical protein n=1 Tax=Agromyces chromiiresistens TaxID=3030835 RepID=UPI0023B91B88|nr:hypothetical protein [Agromyces chromiiresistens]MDF0513053.1 hypothetical protein [Agromyces chromiiresistens]